MIINQWLDGFPNRLCVDIQLRGLGNLVLLWNNATGVWYATERGGDCCLNSIIAGKNADPRDRIGALRY